jgi:hypothetical protein
VEVTAEDHQLSGYYQRITDNAGLVGKGGQPNNGMSSSTSLFEGYYGMSMTPLLQDTDMPLGETTTANEDGSTTKKPSTHH